MTRATRRTAAQGAPAPAGVALAAASEPGELDSTVQASGAPSPIDGYPPGVYVAAWPILHDGREYLAGESLEDVGFEALAILAGCGAAVLVK